MFFILNLEHAISITQNSTLVKTRRILLARVWIVFHISFFENSEKFARCWCRNWHFVFYYFKKIAPQIYINFSMKQFFSSSSCSLQQFTSNLHSMVSKNGWTFNFFCLLGANSLTQQTIPYAFKNFSLCQNQV